MQFITNKFNSQFVTFEWKNNSIFNYDLVWQKHYKKPDSIPLKRLRVIFEWKEENYLVLMSKILEQRLLIILKRLRAILDQSHLNFSKTIYEHLINKGFAVAAIQK